MKSTIVTSGIGGRALISTDIEDNTIKSITIEPTEGPRHIEEMLIGQDAAFSYLYTQRICTACSVSHTLASLKAVEKAYDLTISEQIRKMRELLLAGSFIMSHSNHLYNQVLGLYQEPNQADVQRARSLYLVGSEICKAVGGRAVHPVNAFVGGFKNMPRKSSLIQLTRQLDKARQDAFKTVELFSALKYPVLKRLAQYACLGSEKTYPIYIGSILFSTGLEVKHADYHKHIIEQANGLSRLMVGKRSYYVGALARANINHDLLSKNTQKAIEKAKIKLPSSNPFHYSIAQALEILHLVDRASEIIKDLDLTPVDLIMPTPRHSRGIGIVESPKGLLIHDFTIDKSGKILKAKILSATQQSLASIEEDLYKYIPRIVGGTEQDIAAGIIKLVKSHDSCMQCAVH